MVCKKVFTARLLKSYWTSRKSSKNANASVREIVFTPSIFSEKKMKKKTRPNFNTPSIAVYNLSTVFFFFNICVPPFDNSLYYTDHVVKTRRRKVGVKMREKKNVLLQCKKLQLNISLKRKTCIFLRLYYYYNIYYWRR